MIAILSFPRSGNHFMRYIIEWLSGRPTLGCVGNRKGDSPICRRKNVKFLGHVKGSPLGQKYHTPLWELHKEKELILIQRYPLHSLLSHKPHQPLPYPRNFLKRFNSWNLNVLNFYEEFPHKKLCIYFEDLVEQPQKEIKKIGDFINAPDERIQDFLTNIEKFTQDSKRSSAWSKKDKPSLKEAFALHGKEMMTCLNHPLISSRYVKEIGRDSLWL